MQAAAMAEALCNKGTDTSAWIRSDLYRYPLSTGTPASPTALAACRSHEPQTKALMTRFLSRPGRCVHASTDMVVNHLQCFTTERDQTPCASQPRHTLPTTTSRGPGLVSHPFCVPQLTAEASAAADLKPSVVAMQRSRTVWLSFPGRCVCSLICWGVCAADSTHALTALRKRLAASRVNDLRAPSSLFTQILTV
jgi:hypothetical protein